MKKILLSVIALMTMTMVGNAQTKEDIQQSEKRAAELKKLVDGQPKDCGVAEVDNYAKSINAAALLAIANSEQLSSLYYREIGETKDGVTDVTIKKPTAEECAKLGTTIAGEAATIASAKESAEAAAKKFQELSDQAKNESNPMKKAKIAKQTKTAAAIIAYGKDALPIIIEESAAQGKAIKQLVETVKSAKNL